MGRDNRAVGLGGILRALKLARPHSVISIDEAGKEQRVNLTGARGRYERCAKTLVALECVAFRCMDAKDAVQEIIHVETPDDDPDTGPVASSSDAKEAKRAGHASELAAIVRITLDAQDKATARQSDMLRQVTSAAVEMMAAAAEGIRHASERAGKLDNMLTTLMNRRERELADTARRLEEGLEDLANARVEDSDDSPGAQADSALVELLGMVKMKKPKPPPSSSTH